MWLTTPFLERAFNFDQSALNTGEPELFVVDALGMHCRPVQLVLLGP